MDIPHITRSPYSMTYPRRGGDAVIDFLVMLRENGVYCFIAGGFARWVLSPEDSTPLPGDIDIYFQDEKSFTVCMTTMVFRGFRITLETDNAVTMIPPNTAEFDVHIGVQLIKPKDNRRGSIYDVLDAFDLNICQAALVIQSDNTLMGFVSDAFNIGENKRMLQVITIQNPLAVLQRCMKYAKMGYRIHDKEILKVLTAWDLKTPEQRQKIHEFVNNKNYKQAYDLLWV